eukprot:463953-Amphidinium_carterae.1
MSWVCNELHTRVTRTATRLQSLSQTRHFGPLAGRGVGLVGAQCIIHASPILSQSRTVGGHARAKSRRERL